MKPDDHRRTRVVAVALVAGIAFLNVAPAAAATPGYDQGAEAYRAYARSDFAAAVAAAREAVRLAPSERGYQMLLMQSLAASGDLVGADATAMGIERTFGPSGELEAQRGFYAVSLGRQSDASAHFSEALRLGGLAPDQARNVRLALSDSLTAQGQPARALAALDVLGSEASYEVRSRRAQALLALPPGEAAVIACEQAAALAPAAAPRAYFTRAAILTRIKLRQRAEARAAFERARTSGAFSGSEPVDLAMLLVAVGDDVAAQVYFAQAAQSGQLSGRTALDAAYSAKRAGREGDAARYFAIAFQAPRAGESPIDPATLFGARRDLSNIERVWGLQAYLGYGGEGASFIVPTSEARAATQAGVEVYRRLGGYRGGRTVEGFARVFDTVASDRSADVTGADSLQGWLGLRVRPFADQRLQLEASRMFRIGERARDDWSVRAAYSLGTSADVRSPGSDWWAWSVYLDAARMVQARETLAIADLRAGHGITLGPSGKTIIIPFIGINSSYDNALARPWATGAGPGVTLRTWFRESPDRAPRSYMDLSVQYRARISGDRRGEGLFAVLSVAY